MSRTDSNRADRPHVDLRTRVGEVNMSTAVMTTRLELHSVADTTLKAATRFWFVVVLIGQSVFAFTVASFYGLSALRGDFHGWSKSITHGQWALRLYLVVSASLFIRAGIFLSIFLNHGPFGFDPATFRGPFLTFISFAQYLVPLAVLEIYLRTQDRGSATGRLAMAAGLFILTIALAAGVFAVTMAIWLPTVKAAYDSRTSITETP